MLYIALYECFKSELQGLTVCIVKGQNGCSDVNLAQNAIQNFPGLLANYKLASYKLMIQ